MADELMVVLVNEQEQYCVWQSGKPIPPGWSQVGSEGDKEACLNYISQVWVDMRPRHLKITATAK